MTIWKFTLDPWRDLVEMPKGARLIHVREQNNGVCVWAEVDPDAGMVERLVYIVGTGHPLLARVPTYVGTAHIVEAGVPLVLHVYDGGET